MPRGAGEHRDRYQPNHEILIDGPVWERIFQSVVVRSSLQTILTRSRRAYGFPFEAEQGVVFFLDPITASKTKPNLIASMSDEAECNAIGISEKVSEERRQLLYAGQYPVFRFHIHTAEPVTTNLYGGIIPTTPYESSVFKPSAGDLGSLAWMRAQGEKEAGYYGFPISAIGIVYKDQFRILLIQETMNSARSARTMEMYEQDTGSNDSLQEVLEALQQYGYKAGVIMYDPGNKKNPISETAKTVLHSFKFALKPTTPIFRM